MSGLGERIATFRRRLAGEGIGAVLARAGAGTFLVGAVSAGLAVVLQVAISRWLGADEFGRYAYVLSWVNFAALLAVLGFDTAALRFVAHYRVLSDWPALRGFLLRSTTLAFAAAVLVAVGIAIAGARVHPKGEDLTRVMRTGAIVLPSLVVLKLLASQLQGFRRVIVGGAVQGILRPVLLAILVASVWLGDGAVTADHAMLLNVVATAVGAAVLLVIMMRTLPTGLRGVAARYETKLWITTAGPLLLISAAQALLISTDTLMLGSMRGTREAGLYSVAAQLVTVITLGISASNGIVAPMIAELNSKGDRAGLQRLLSLSARGVLLYALPVVAGLALVGRPLLGIYGREFEASYLPMMVLAVGQLGIVAFGSVGFLLTMSGHERIASATIVGSALLNIALNLVLIPRYGAIGASTATAIATTARSAALTLWAKYRLGMTATVFGS